MLRLNHWASRSWSDAATAASHSLLSLSLTISSSSRSNHYQKKIERQILEVRKHDFMTEVQNLKPALNNFHNNHLNIRVSIGPSGSSRLTQIYFCLVDMWGWTFHYTVGGTNKILASLKYNVLIGSLADCCAWYRVWWDPNSSSLKPPQSCVRPVTKCF